MYCQNIFAIEIKFDKFSIEFVVCLLRYHHCNHSLIVLSKCIKSNTIYRNSIRHFGVEIFSIRSQFDFWYCSFFFLFCYYNFCFLFCLFAEMRFAIINFCLPIEKCQYNFYFNDLRCEKKWNNEPNTEKKAFIPIIGLWIPC